MELYHIAILRDVALSFENKNKQIALDLISIALKHRPEGDLLHAKFADYSKSLIVSNDISDSLVKAINLVDDAWLLKFLDVCLYLEPNNRTFLSLKNEVSFTHYVELKKNSSINLDLNFDVIPFGSRCTSAVVCHYAQLLKESLPFDWTIPLLPCKTQQILEQDFKDFIPSNIGEKGANNKYGVGLAHFSAHESHQDGINIYNLRIDRFQALLNSSTHKYFVYVNEDYLYKSEYRNEHFNKQTFEEMLLLEGYLKGRYPHFTFNILYFDFVQHDIIENSSIVPFFIKTGKYWSEGVHSNYSSFRKYIGKVLSELFNTEFDNKVNVDELFAK